jgi:ribonuclease P protein component
VLSAARLRRSRDIASVRERGRAVRRPSFGLRAAPSAAPLTRVMVSAPRTLGGAVMRNRARRRLREAFRRVLPGPRSLDVIVSARAPALDAPFAALVAEAASALEEAGR